MVAEPSRTSPRRDLAALIIQKGGDKFTKEAAATALAILGPQVTSTDSSAEGTTAIRAVGEAMIGAIRPAKKHAQHGIAKAPWKSDNWAALAYINSL